MNNLISFLSIIAASSTICACTMVSAEEKMVMEPLQQNIIERTINDLEAKPATVTCFIAERSAGTKHDFYSEGDYWWPDSLNPDGPYVRRDGETNPRQFCRTPACYDSFQPHCRKSDIGLSPDRRQKIS